MCNFSGELCTQLMLMLVMKCKRLFFNNSFQVTWLGDRPAGILAA